MKSPKKVCNQADCQHKGKLQTITNYKDYRQKDGRQNACKDCVKKRNKRPVFPNPMTEEQMKQWNLDNPVVLTVPMTVEGRVING